MGKIILRKHDCNKFERHVALLCSSSDYDTFYNISTIYFDKEKGSLRGKCTFFPPPLSNDNHSNKLTVKQ